MNRNPDAVFIEKKRRMTKNSLSGVEFKRSGDEWLKNLSTNEANHLLALFDEKIEALRLKIQTAKAADERRKAKGKGIAKRKDEWVDCFNKPPSAAFDPQNVVAFASLPAALGITTYGSHPDVYGVHVSPPSTEFGHYNSMEFERNAPPCTASLSVAYPLSQNLPLLPAPGNTTGDEDNDGGRRNGNQIMSEVEIFGELSPILAMPKNNVNLMDECFNTVDVAEKECPQSSEPPVTENAKADDINISDSAADSELSDNGAMVVDADDFAFLDGISFSPIAARDFESAIGLDNDTFFSFDVEDEVPEIRFADCLWS